jgi:Asp-tRNA(Asn)/Glu-tRNA(Gln) amidotransferase A subunit family amidase
LRQPNKLSAAQARRAITAGDLTASELTRACLARIKAREPVVRAWAHLDPELAVRQARHADARTSAALLHGVPVGIKDVIDTADMPTEMGSPIYAGRRPAQDAECVTRLRGSGAIIIGKTVTTEFACFQPGPTRNPVNPGYTPGGSSSGSAAAVADWMVPLALGTQTAGSIARPASFCGTVGYVSSHGSLPLGGVKKICPSLDSLGVLARSVEDVQLVRAVLTGAGYGPGAGRSAPPRPALVPLRSLRIGAITGDQLTDVAPAMRSALKSACDQLANAGAPISALELPARISELVSIHEHIMCFEAARSLAYEMQFSELMSHSLLDMLEAGNRMPGWQYRKAKESTEAARPLFDEIYTRFDVLIAPAAPGPALPGLSSTGSPVLSRPWQVMGLPVVVLPAGKTAHGLPLGVQVIAPQDRDNQLLEIASTITSVLDQYLVS